MARKEQWQHLMARLEVLEEQNTQNIRAYNNNMDIVRDNLAMLTDKVDKVQKEVAMVAKWQQDHWDVGKKRG